NTHYLITILKMPARNFNPLFENILTFKCVFQLIAVKKKLLLLFALFFAGQLLAQDISLYQQFNGRYDFVFLGNTMNPVENSFQIIPAVNTESSATLNLAPGNTIEKAYLYWAGSGTGDFEILLNGAPLTAERTFSHQRLNGFLVLDYFSAFVDVTSQVMATGN